MRHAHMESLVFIPRVYLRLACQDMPSLRHLLQQCMPGRLHHRRWAWLCLREHLLFRTCGRLNNDLWACTLAPVVIPGPNAA